MSFWNIFQHFVAIAVDKIKTISKIFTNPLDNLNLLLCTTYDYWMVHRVIDGNMQYVILCNF